MTGNKVAIFGDLHVTVSGATPAAATSHVSNYHLS